MRRGIDPTQQLRKSCDCSGLVAWSIGIPRELPPGSNHWLNTDCIWDDGDPHHGHVAIILQIDKSLPSLIIHCSLGNYKTYGDAIRINDASIFLSANHPTRVMQINYEELNSFI